MQLRCRRASLLRGTLAASPRRRPAGGPPTLRRAVFHTLLQPLLASLPRWLLPAGSAVAVYLREAVMFGVASGLALVASWALWRTVEGRERLAAVTARATAAAGACGCFVETSADCTGPLTAYCRACKQHLAGHGTAQQAQPQLAPHLALSSAAPRAEEPPLAPPNPAAAEPEEVKRLRFQLHQARQVGAAKT